MSVVLEPVSGARLKPLTLSDGVLAVGRAEPPFDAYPAELVAGLADQQGRIFHAMDNYFLVDLVGTGTTHNGRPVGRRPAELGDGDQVCFTERLCYRVRIEGSADRQPADPILDMPTVPQRLAPLCATLTPAADAAATGAIALSHFPFLISRETGLFSLLGARFPEAVKTLSRRHAYLSLDGGRLYIEELGSTNGSKVNGERLQPHRRRVLQDGDELALGSEQLRFTVRVDHQAALPITAQTAQLSGPQVSASRSSTAPPAADDTGVLFHEQTLYPTLADSFLHIFCDPEESPSPSPQQQDNGAAPRGRLAAWRRELAEALAGPRAQRRYRWPLWAGLALVLAVAAGGYVYTAPKRELRALYAQGEYRQAADAARRYLAGRSGDAEIERLALDAFTRALLPDWLAAADGGDAGAVLDAASAPTARGQELLDALAWVTDLRRFVGERRTGDGLRLTLLQDEQPVETLLRRYRDGADWQRLLVEVGNAVPAFEPLRAATASRLRLLQSEGQSFLQAATELRRGLAQLLRDGRPEQAAERLAEFERRYPRVSGSEPLRADLERLAQLQRAVAGDDLNAVLALGEVEYDTALVAAAAADWRATRLPGKAALDRYRQALAAWQAGDGARARALLQPLVEQPGGAMAAAKLRRFEAVSAAFSALPNQGGEQLLQFYAGLDPVEDRYFVTAVEADARRQRQAALASAGRLFAAARDAWQTYRDGGGIDGLLRLEKNLSETFRRRSEALQQAYSQANQAARLYRLLRLKLPPPDAELVRRVGGEVRRQRQWLSDLAVVLRPQLLAEKLALLPDPAADGADDDEPKP